MKYVMYPQCWEAVQAAFDEAGFTQLGMEQLGQADFLFFTGGADDLPESLPESLGFVQLPFAGVDALLPQMRELTRTCGTRWSNAAGLYDETVAESAIALLLAQLHAHRRVGDSWGNRDEVESHTAFLFEDKTVAIVGAGGIGKRLIEMLCGFGPEIIAVNRSGKDVPGADRTIPTDQIEKIWPAADYFVLLLPLTDETHHVVDRRALEQMPEHAVVINVGRGPLVDTDALVKALREGGIAGAGLDVTDPEPLPDGHPLWEMPQVVITPHVANPPYSVKKRSGAHAVSVARAFAHDGSLPTEVDVDAGY
ncbi:D-isomer specific 2-hydroxyacid dehydrogenase family protein [Corynebacterium confusum]|uniref:D-isomer specific 2-hydroxyacid dehydrogenase family protein n=1 Tax=Corynebacterium confusum TaxID=71254 RepID=UPI0025B5C556|nr:D-isomer specific 2-hydroxyacid dehydrogenase family protein [Corynebacterium confusum]WJY90295.1 D-specific alpha-keto acid dehydrogenase [Corynebacterium confusum]